MASLDKTVFVSLVVSLLSLVVEDVKAACAMVSTKSTKRWDRPAKSVSEATLTKTADGLLVVVPSLDDDKKQTNPSVLARSATLELALAAPCCRNQSMAV